MRGVKTEKPLLLLKRLKPVIPSAAKESPGLRPFESPKVGIALSATYCPLAMTCHPNSRTEDITIEAIVGRPQLLVELYTRCGLA